MRKYLVPMTAIGFIAVGAFSFSAVAAPYGPAGCGLGAMLIGNKAGFMQIFAGTTNGVSGNQSFGITTGSLGCDVDGGDKAAAFIEANREALAKDSAKGAGETIANLTALAGCSDANAVGATLQANFDKIFPNSGTSDRSVSQNMVNTLKSVPALQCAELI